MTDAPAPSIEASESDPLDMQTLLLEIVRALVDMPSKAAVTEQSTDSTVFLTVHVDPSDVGKILGKQGSTIHLLRDLFTKISAVDGSKISLEISDPRAAERPRRTRSNA